MCCTFLTNVIKICKKNTLEAHLDIFSNAEMFGFRVLVIHILESILSLEAEKAKKKKKTVRMSNLFSTWL